MRYDDFHRTPEGDLLTEIFLTTFRLNGLILAAGNRLGAEEGLPSARFQADVSGRKAWSTSHKSKSLLGG